ncbi:MAG: tetratricopeptide repeat protein [Polyangiaceae bacterium]
MSFRFIVRLRVFLMVLLVASLSFAQKDPKISDAARTHFKAGVAYLDDPNGPKYEEALQEFRKAYAESPSSRIMNNIGFCALNLERDGEAIEAYEAFLAGNSSDLTPKVRKQVEQDIAMLKTSLVKVTLTGEPQNISIVDERRNSQGALVVNRYKLGEGSTALGIHPGHHRMTASVPGYEPVEWEFEAEPASSHQHAFKLTAKGSDQAAPVAATEAKPLPPSNVTQPPASQPRRVHPGVYVGAIAAGVFAAAATTTGVLTLSKHKDFEAADKRDDDKEADRLSKSGKRLALLTDIGIGAAILSAGVATYFYFASPGKSTEKSPSSAALQLTPSVGTDRAGLSLVGNF